jgi:hypothetical protein
LRKAWRQVVRIRGLLHRRGGVEPVEGALDCCGLCPKPARVVGGSGLRAGLATLADRCFRRFVGEWRRGMESSVLGEWTTEGVRAGAKRSALSVCRRRGFATGRKSRSRRLDTVKLSRSKAALSRGSVVAARNANGPWEADGARLCHVASQARQWEAHIGTNLLMRWVSGTCLAQCGTSAHMPTDVSKCRSLWGRCGGCGLRELRLSLPKQSS